MTLVSRLLAVCALAAGALQLAGCAGLYFHPAGPPPAEPVRFGPGELPFREYWTGIVFNGDKIGFTRFHIAPAADDPTRHEIRSEASFVLRFLGIEKKINLKARDLVNDDLTLAEFAHEYRIDGSELQLSGRREPAGLAVTIVSAGKPAQQRLAVEGALYPASVIALYPVAHGLALGREYRYQVYNGQTQSLADVTQRVAAYEKSQFFEGNAFKVETSAQGQGVTTWIDLQGRPAFELGMRGVMISALEDPETAQRYVALGSLNQRESLVEFSLVRPDRPIERPRLVSALKVALSGVDRVPPTDASQRCGAASGGSACDIRRADVPVESAAPPAGADTVLERYLLPSITVQSNDPSIRLTARAIVAGSATPAEQVARIVEWMQKNIEKAPLDVFSALDVLEKRRAECQGHAWLYAALARASGLPTRVVNGLAYSQDLKGFLYHSWAESRVAGRWLPVDPTFGQVSADATHIKLIEGEALADLVPLLDWVGKLKIRVLAVEHQRP